MWDPAYFGVHFLLRFFFFTDKNTVYFLKIRAWQVIYNPAGNEHE